MYWGLAIPIVIGFGVILGFGTYIFYQLICYLKEKPQTLQTLLDRIYGQHFQIIIIRSWCVGIAQSVSVLSLNIPSYITNPLALVQCLKSDLIQESEPEDLLLSPLTLAMPLTLISLIKPLALTLKSDLIFHIGPGLIIYNSTNYFSIF